MEDRPTSREKPDPRHRLSRLRNALLGLHKTLVDSERATYEATAGPVGSPSQFLQLLTDDAWFAWLRPLSKLIVAADVALEEPEPVPGPMVDLLVTRARRLLVAAEGADGFPGHYHQALQRDPDVVMAHAEVAKLLGPRKSPDSA
jgi:hypothetical protein